MPPWGEALVAAACLVGIVGTVLPVLPGHMLVGGAIVVWAAVEGGWVAWGAALTAVAVLAAGTLLTYLLPGRRLAAAGVPNRSILAGGVLGVVGFFVVPVVGLPLGFVLGVYLAELARLRGHGQAWPSTLEAMRSTGWSVLIGMTAAVLATSVWAAAAVLT